MFSELNIVSYIIIAILVALIFHIISKMYKKERYTDLEKVAPPVKSQVKETELLLGGDIKTGDWGKTKPKDCVKCSTELVTDDFIRRGQLYNANICKEPKQYSRDDLKDYRDDFYSFRNYIQQSSHNDDPVDIINDLYLSGDYDISKNNKGMSIKDVYDSITKSTELYESPCVRMPIVDNVTKTGQYLQKGNVGEYYVRDNWMYDHEKVNNGGNFYKNIYPDDPNMARQMVVK